MSLKAFILSTIIAIASLCAKASETADSAIMRPATVTVMANAGAVRSLDTYISPLMYQGMHLRIGFDRLRALKFCPEKWVGRIEAGLTYDHPDNPAGNNSLHTVIADADYAMLRQWRVAGGLTVGAGGGIGFRGGVTYNPRNSNNVCSPLIRLYAGASGMAAYRCRLRRLPLTIRWQATLPVVGGFYLPDYDQSFYEMYLGNYRSTINFGFWHNRFDMDNLACVDLHFGTSSLRLGYRNEFTTVWENNISQRRTVHCLVVGLQWESLHLNMRHTMPVRAKIISASY